MNKTENNLSQWQLIKERYSKNKFLINCIFLSYLFLLNCIWSKVTFIVFPLLCILTLISDLKTGFSYLVFGYPFSLMNPNLSSILYYGGCFLYILKVFYFIFIKERKKLHKTILITIIIFLFYCCLPFGKYDYNFFIKIAYFIFIISVLIAIVYKREIFRPTYNISIICYSLITSCVIALMYPISAFLQITMPIKISSSLIRFPALLGHTNTLAMVCEILLSLLFYLIITKDHKLKNLILFAIISLIGLSTLSKTFFIILGILLICLFIYMLKYNKKRTLIVSGILMIIAIIFTAIFPNLIISISARFVGKINQCHSVKDFINMITTKRLDIWIEYVTYIFTHPKTLLFGNGLGAEVISVMSAHNAYISLIYQLGLVGTGLFVYVVYLFIKEKKDLKINKAIIIPIIIIALILFVEDTLLYIM